MGPPDILYRDDALVVINKPSGLAVHKGWARDEVYAMTMARDAVGAFVYPVHRLDRATSGVLLFALSPEDAEAVQAQLRAHTVAKRYLALVRGVTAEVLVIDRPLAPKPGAEPQPATTRLRRLWVYAGRYSLLEAWPESGRLHQIRRHLRGLSHPIIGDVRYGRGEENRRFRADHGLHRLALHACRLSLRHPRTAAPLTLHAPLTGDLAGPLLRLGIPPHVLEP